MHVVHTASVGRTVVTPTTAIVSAVITRKNYTRIFEKEESKNKNAYQKNSSDD
jgi:hypothetical protein